MQLVWLSLLATAPLVSSKAAKDHQATTVKPAQPKQGAGLTPTPDQLTCAIDGAGSLDAATNAGVYLWAATERCAKGTAQSDEIKCEIDVASAIQSVTDMGNIIAKAIDSCAGGLAAENAQCGMAAGSLISATGGLTAKAGALAHWITTDTKGGNVVVGATTTRVGKCIVNAKSVVNDIFQAAAAIKAAKAQCADSDQEKCAASSLTVISLLSGIGSAIANVVGLCSPTDDKTARMSGDMIGLVGVLDKVAQAGMAVSQQCKVSDARLYSGIATQSTSNGISMSSLVAFAVIPMAAIFGFVGGRRNKAMSRDEVRDVERMGMIQLGEEVMAPSDRD
jgi:hypothetical protein